jgi:D-alanine transaminase
MQDLPDTLCYLNGDYTPLNMAKVSVLDRGFLFGDGIYEAVPVYARSVFRFDEHMARLDRSLAKVRIANPHTAAEWLARCRKLIDAHPADNQLLYLQVTRGVALRDHVMPTGIEPTVFMMTSAMKPPSAEQRHRGVACTTARDFRWERGDIKSISLLGNVLARQMSADHGAAAGPGARGRRRTAPGLRDLWPPAAILHGGLGPGLEPAVGRAGRSVRAGLAAGRERAPAGR